MAAKCVRSTNVETVAAFLYMIKGIVDASGAFLPSVWLFGARTRLSRGRPVNTDQREPWTVRKGNERSQQGAESIWDVLNEWSNSDLFLFLLRVCGPRSRTPAPGPRRSKRWWRAQRAAAASGSSCGRSSARRTWCSGSPVRSWRRRPTRLWLRRKSVRYTRTSSPSSLQKRCGFDEEGRSQFCLTLCSRALPVCAFRLGQSGFARSRRDKPEHAGANLAHVRGGPTADLHADAEGLVPALHQLSHIHGSAQEPGGASSRAMRLTHTFPPKKEKRRMCPTRREDLSFPAGVQDKPIPTGCGPALTALFRCD